MSNARYSILAARAVFDKRLSNADKVVLAALGTYTDREGWCFPSQKELVTRLGIVRSTVCAAIKKLSAAEFSYIEVRARTSKGRGKIGNEYRVKLDLPPMSVLADNGKMPMSDVSDIGPQATVIAPMSDGKDNGADVRMVGHPMSDGSDIAYKEVTTPRERTQQSVSNETDVVSVYEKAQREKFAAKQSKPASKRKTTTYTPEFNAVWLSWPAHRRANSDKPTAFKRWQTGTAQFGVEPVAAAAKRYLSLPDTKKENFRYCCLVEVFMNGKLEAAVEAAMGAENQNTSAITAEQWDMGLKMWRTNGQWITELGPKPNQPGYRGPRAEGPHA